MQASARRALGRIDRHRDPRPTTQVVHETVIFSRLAFVQRLLERIEPNLVCIQLLWRQPTMRRMNTSTLNATYTQPCQVET